MFLLPFTLLVTGIVLSLVLAERDHRKRRRRLGLAPEPTMWSDFVDGLRARRVRAEQRAGIRR